MIARYLMATLLLFALDVEAKCKALLKAVEKLDVSKLETIIAKGADVNCKAEYKVKGERRAREWSPLSVVTLTLPIQPAKHEILELLLESGAIPNHYPDQEYPLLTYSWFYMEDDVRALEILLAAGADATSEHLVTIPNGARFVRSSINAWLFAYPHSSSEMLSLLLEAGAKIPKEGDTSPSAWEVFMRPEVQSLAKEYIEKDRIAAAREAELALQAEMQRDAEQIAERLSETMRSDAGLSAMVREDKYRFGLNRSLTRENWTDAALYFGLLEKINAQLEPELLFFKGEMHLEFGQYKEAIAALHTCALQLESGHEYYSRALMLALDVSRQDYIRKNALGESDDLSQLIAATDVSINQELRINKYIIGLSDALISENNEDALLFFDLLKANQHSVDPSLQFYLGKTLVAVGRTEAGLRELQSYVNNAGRDGQHYTEALSLILDAGG